jgi:hypothetical protein
MAKLPNIQLSGRMGDLIFYVRNGKQCMRSMPRKVKNPKSKAQTRQRTQFASASSFASSLLKELIHPYWNAIAKKENRTGYNFFLSSNLPAFTNSEILTKKLILVPENSLQEEKITAQKNETAILLKWYFEKASKRAQADDALSLLLLSETNALEIKRNIARRSDQELILCLDKAVSVFAFWERDGLWSESRYIIDFRR